LHDISYAETGDGKEEDAYVPNQDAGVEESDEAERTASNAQCDDQNDKIGEHKEGQWREKGLPSLVFHVLQNTYFQDERE
jgi:hypothetical protein